MDLFETAPEMQNGFMIVANLLISAWTQRILTLRGDRPIRDLHDLPVGSMEETFQNGRHLKKLPDKLRAFVKQAAKLHMRIVATEKTGDTKGQYFTRHGQPEIVLFYNDALFVEHREQINAGNATILGRFLRSRHDTLVHELRHAYDDFASTGKYRFSPEAIKAGQAQAQANDDASRQQAHQAYLLQPHEISARFTQTVSTLTSYLQGSWRDYSAQFKQHFYGWYELPPKAKLRLLKRLATQWIDAHGERQPTDINPFIAKLDAKLGGEIRVLPAHGNIEIAGLARAPRSKQATALQQVTYLADILRRQVVTYDDVPMLKGFDFVRNQGRNIDYRVSARYRREPRSR